MPELLAGAAVADITPPVGVMMDGYGARTTPSQGVHDPLMARVVALEKAGASAAIVSCDLLGMHPWITAEVRRRAEEGHGIRADGVIVAATHDHAAPIGLRAGMFARLDEAAAATLVETIMDAIGEAWEARRAASLSVAQARVDTISQNRRDPDWPIDSELRVVLVDGEAGPIASIVNFACHATVLNADNLFLSGEFPGHAARLLLRETGAPCVYLNGACGDVNPSWIRQDFASVERAGQIVGGAALRLVAEMRALGPGQRIHNVRWDEFPEVAPLGRTVVASLKVARREVEIPARDFEDDESYVSRIEQAKMAREGAGDESARRGAAALISRYEGERWAAAWARRSPTPERTEVQVIRLGKGLAVVALPGEFLTETGEAVRAAVDGDVVVAGYANDYVGYVVPEHSYDEGGYEPGVTFYAPEAESIIRESAISLLKEVCDGD
ncbi:MAG TPA: neutral/alkaline non-lysosomal ceramidase N-terminal domain-containing protein [Dehalococcoidia bacterium]|nr:neutral/alkaline non-lysosomal ceramidase N-terminal domain-containing protein [Dehalococcoidia bacterium]